MSDDIPHRAAMGEDQVDGLPGAVATVRWFQGMAVAGIFAALLMALPAVVLFLGGEDTMAMALIPGIPALLVLYWALATTLNRTTIVYGARLTVRHSPLPWSGTLDVTADRVTAFELRELRFVRRGRHVRSDWHAVAIVYGTPHRLLQGVAAHAENKWLVGVCQRALAARQASASPTNTAPSPSAAVPTTVAAVSHAPTSAAAAPASHTPALPAPLEQCFATLRSAGAHDVDRLVAAVRPLAPYLRAPFSAVLPEGSRLPQIRALLPREGQPAFGEQHLKYRPDDYQKLPWVRHIDQVVPLFQLDAENVLRIGLRRGIEAPAMGIEARTSLTIEEAVRRQPHIEAAAASKLTEVLATLGAPCSAIESRIDPPSLVTSTFWFTANPTLLDGCAAALGVNSSHREALAALLKTGIVPARVGVTSTSNRVLSELWIELTDKSVALAIYGADTPLSIRLRAVAPPSAACVLRIGFHAEAVPVIEVETTG